MISRPILLVLLAIGCVLPVAITIVWAVGRLLLAMHDEAGATVLDRLALALGVLWSIDLVCLLLAQSINSLPPPDKRS